MRDTCLKVRSVEGKRERRRYNTCEVGHRGKPNSKGERLCFFLTKRIGKSLGGSKFWDDGAACERRWTEFILVKNTNGETKLLPAETEKETESGMH